ncbi:MAG: T9SS type A sorting domain-containing protein [Candidatus Eisenbacteria bacterium]|uniref:T9SS type A sorting domain-containing protein n=1 Tax=Eiseniibacteriota bacterium TaxID=2212470 RepID=A0A956NFW8_UNCEI|nr:T9SS type A sorting domain-containing protein [Candidatus Eisenbacteria bacterium]
MLRSTVFLGLLSALLAAKVSVADGGGAVTAPSVSDGTPTQENRANCYGIQQHHDDSFESAYGWTFDAVADPYYGAFAECFEGVGYICQVQYWLTQLGNQNGQTMDLIVWEDDHTGNPGAVLYLIPSEDPGPVAQWPSVSRHDFELGVFVPHEKWWAGYWGNWAGAQAGWFVAADENGPGGGCPRTNIAPDIGYPAGWEHPNVVLPWEDCRSLGIQVDFAVDPAALGEQADTGHATIAARIDRLSPNPFRDRVEVEYRVERRGTVSLSVHDAQGRLVAALVDGATEPGVHRTAWDGRRSDGSVAEAGIYFVRVVQGGAVSGTQLVRIR